MKFYSLLTVLLLCGNALFAQSTPDTAHSYTVALINKEKLQQIQATAGTCVLLKVWIPNCGTAIQQFKEFADFEQSATYKIIYVGITNDPNKIINIARSNDYKGALYMLDTAICPDVYKRYDIFCTQVAKAYKAQPGNFDTMIIDSDGKLVLKDNILGFPEKLKKKC